MKGDSWLEIVRLKSGYYVYGYIRCLGGPYTTYEQAEKRILYVEQKWRKK